MVRVSAHADIFGRVSRGEILLQLSYGGPLRRSRPEELSQ
jgi:hypothetical protein